MTTPDLRSLTSGSADFSEEIDAAAPRFSRAPHGDFMGDIRPDQPEPGTLTIDMDLPPVNAAPKPKGSKRRLAEIAASIRRLDGMSEEELERIRRRRVQWLGDL